VGSDAESDVVNVTATDENPRVAAAIANAYVEQYISFRQAADRSQLSHAEQLVGSELAAVPPSQRHTAAAQSLETRRTDLQLLATLQTGNAEVVATATPPTSPSGPQPSRDAIIGLVLGLLVGAALVVVIDRRDCRIRSREEIERRYKVPIIGALPLSLALEDGGAGTAEDRDAIRMIRAQLRYFNIARDVKEVLVTSASTGEGKSTVALNLARLMAQMDRTRVLLLEADLRRPTIAGMTGLDKVAGLAALLTDFNDLEAGLRELVVPGQADDGTGSGCVFDVLLAGATPANPGELLESTGMMELMEILRTMYDLVIIDAPAIGVVSDAVPLAHRADGVLVITRVDYTRRDDASQLMERLEGLNARVLGVVVNCVHGQDAPFAIRPHPSIPAGLGRPRELLSRVFPK
jgi:receptor protein-tyrosine kinase